jgi:hypothetical protein
MKEFSLEENEAIVGFFGETFDNFCDCFKSFGFIIG